MPDILFNESMSKEDYFKWLQERFITVYNEDLNFDFVQNLTNPAFYEDNDSITWLYERMYFIYGENVSEDFMMYLNEHGRNLPEKTWANYSTSFGFIYRD